MTTFRFALFIALVLAPASDVVGQEPGAQDWQAALWDREAMVNHLQMLERLAESPAYSGDLRAQYRLEAQLIRARLEQGDFRVGDRVVLFVEGEEVLSETFTVNNDRALDLPGIGEIPLAGVLRSELEGHLETHLGRFLKEPVVRAEPLIRLTILGAVNQPGFYSLSWEALVGDVLMIAGGPSPNAAVDKLRIERRGEQVWGGAALQNALIAGYTLDQLSLIAGDEIYLPTGGSFLRNLRNVSLVISIPASIVFMFVRIF